ncbi:MAG: DUF2294 domain-containing protein [Gemmataceae bacterium]|nr:DUF2294 domain-containing protein [Gemmataceae bacterium]MDW8267418.1 DUF2294 domain-containing protein [Gemmataceae bacterium]
MKSRGELESEVCQVVVQFWREQFGRGPARIQANVIGPLVYVYLWDSLSRPEQKLAHALHRPQACELLKRARFELIEQGRPLLAEALKAVLGTDILCLHTDVSTRTGDSVLVFRCRQEPLTADHRPHDVPAAG